MRTFASPIHPSPRTLGKVPRVSRHGSFWSAICAVLLGMGLVCHAQSSFAEGVSRGAAIARALAQNPQVAASRAVEAHAEAQREQARAARLPSIILTAGVGPALKAKVEPGTAVGSTESAYGDLDVRDVSVVLGGRIELLQPLYTFGKISERLRAAELQLRARQAQTEMTRAEVAVAVARLYEAQLFARDAERFFDETELWLTRTIDTTREEIAANTGVTEQDLLRLQAGLGSVRLGKNQAAAGRLQAQAGLVAFLGYAAGTALEPSERGLELLPTVADEARALVQLGLRDRPELRALALGHAAFGALADAEQADDRPDLFALGFVSGAYTPGREWVQSRFVVDPLNNFVPGLLLGARWVISGSAATERAAQSRARASELEHTKNWAVQAVPAEVTKALEDVRRAKRDADEADDAAQMAKQWLVRASADFSVGLGDSRSVAESATAFSQLRVATFDAKFRHNVALAELARATGTLRVDNSRFYPTH